MFLNLEIKYIEIREKIKLEIYLDFYWLIIKIELRIAATVHTVAGKYSVTGWSVKAISSYNIFALDILIVPSTLLVGKGFRMKS